jgi:branched-subunit amino acid aminotransferase/4-amino-4-deoxychorismate lyase
MLIYLNGEVVEEGEARLSARDRGVLFGDGLFETVRAYGGKPFRMDRHLARLRRGCEELHLTLPLPDEEIEGAVGELYRLNVGEGDAYVRITVTGGLFDGSRNMERSAPPNFFILVEPYHGYPQEFYRRGMRLALAAARRNSTSPLPRLKSNNYLESLMAKQEARDREADEALFLNERGEVAEAASANIFWSKGGVLFTPAVGCGILPGITREAVLELCEADCIPCEQGSYDLDALLQAEESFLTVSTGEVVPVAEIEGRSLQGPCPGPVTSLLAHSYRELVRMELGL